MNGTYDLLIQFTNHIPANDMESLVYVIFACALYFVAIVSVLYVISVIGLLFSRR